MGFIKDSITLRIDLRLPGVLSLGLLPFVLGECPRPVLFL